MRTRVLIVIAVAMSAMAFVKQGYCLDRNWAQPATNIHMCYTDIAPLYTARNLDLREWPYSQGEKSFEYPVLTGAITYMLALKTSTPTSFYLLNAYFLIALFLACAFLIHRFKPEFSYLYPLAPAGALALFINWDLWAIVSMMGAIIWFDRKRYDLSALALGVSVATKFMPIFLLLPIALLLLRAKAVKDLLRYFAIFIATFLIINAPVALTTPTGWAHFYIFNIKRSADWGSLWYALQIFKINFSALNLVALIALLCVLALAAIITVGAPRSASLADLAFIVMALVFAVNKVYSPQYVLWLIPLAVVALRDKRDLHAFWIWQSGEVIYYVSVWQYLALLEGAKIGLSIGLYGLAILIRILASIYLIERLVARLRVKIHSGAADFLFDSSHHYP